MFGEVYFAVRGSTNIEPSSFPPFLPLPGGIETGLWGENNIGSGEVSYILNPYELFKISCCLN
jgi:hypothetical protein